MCEFLRMLLFRSDKTTVKQRLKGDQWKWTYRVAVVVCWMPGVFGTKSSLHNGKRMGTFSHTLCTDPLLNHQRVVNMYRSHLPQPAYYTSIDDCTCQTYHSHKNTFDMYRSDLPQQEEHLWHVSLKLTTAGRTLMTCITQMYHSMKTSYDCMGQTYHSMKNTYDCMGQTYHSRLQAEYASTDDCICPRWCARHTPAWCRPGTSALFWWLWKHFGSEMSTLCCS